MITMYFKMMSELPLYHPTENQPRKCYRLIDFSEPFFGITAVTGMIGIITNIIDAEDFDIAVSSFCAAISLIGIWRVRSLGTAKEVMDSVDDLKMENDKLSVEVDNFRVLTGIMDTHNKSAEEIQQELFSVVERYKQENDRQERNNQIALFYTTDRNRDGKLTDEEIQILRQILKEDYNIQSFLENDTEITRKEFFNKLLEK
jgi:DNA repair exonuclease SbcCD nuclease subunit